MADYDLASYAQMLQHEERISAYTDAIRAAIKPGSVVLEIGTGTGYMALLACKYGASRVYAIEPVEAIVVARQAARDNGFADRIVFHRARSNEVTLPERCDVLISDLRGASAFYTTHLTDLMDARERLLTKDAVWICQTDTFYVAVAEAPQGRNQLHAWWDGSAAGLDLSSALRYVVNQPIRRPFELKELLTPSEPWASIHYPSLLSPHVRGRVTLTVERHAPADGFALWFEAKLHGGTRFSNSPEKPPNVYRHLFLPWPKVVSLQVGDRVEVRLDAVLSGLSYEWNWETVIWRKGETQALATFKQSTLQGHLLDAETMLRSTASYKPVVSPFAEEELFLLERIDGQTTQGQLAAALRARFPDRFQDEAAAFARVVRATGHLNH